MKDIQSERDSRKIDIRKVGVKNISYPIVVMDKAQSRQHTVANVNMYVNLPHLFKGTHMSRFVEILSETHGQINIRNFQDILVQMKNRLDAEASHLEMFFPYFCTNALRSHWLLPVKYQCGLHGSLVGDPEIRLSLSVPVFHSNSAGKTGERWGCADFLVGFHRFYWLEDIIELVEKTIAGQLQTNECRAVLNESRLASVLVEQLEMVDEINNFTVTVYRENENLTSFSRLSSGCQDV